MTAIINLFKSISKSLLIKINILTLISAVWTSVWSVKLMNAGYQCYKHNFNTLTI
jgi:hypothetical protein